MKGDEFLVFAEKLVARLLVSPHLDPAAARSAISRGYYGAYHISFAFLGELGFATGDRHPSVWRHLQAANATNAKLAGDKLCSLYESRRRADYKIDDHRWSELAFAKQCVEEAREIQQLIANCATSSKQVQQEIAASLARQGGRLL
jgi:hypothetical protein